jgi:hypothetical protein
MSHRVWENRVMSRLGLSVVFVCVFAIRAEGQQPRLSVQGDPYFEGSMTMTLWDPGGIGQVPLVAYGLEPLEDPLSSEWGPWYIGQLLGVLPLPPIDPIGWRVDLPFTMPPNQPWGVGIHLVVQGWSGNVLSNPVTVPLAEPYYLAEDAVVIASPEPGPGFVFGERVSIGDLNDDGLLDIIAGAYREDTNGIDRSGAAYVLWGPDYSSSVRLISDQPVTLGYYGHSVTVADVDSDTVDDLIVSEGTGDPPIPGRHGRLHVYLGGATFSDEATFALESDGTGVDYTSFGRRITTGDFNGDTFVDIAVATKEADGGFASAGQVDIYWGPDFHTIYELLSPDPMPSDYFGTDMYMADVNGDGIDDLLESSAREDVGGEINIGRVHLFVGPGLTHFKTIENPLPEGYDSRFGNDVMGVDINGDGKAEVVTSDEHNRVYIFWSPDFDTFQVIERPPGLGSMPSSSVSFGYFLEAGDVNDDGYVDILVSDVFAGQLDCSFGRGGVIYVALGPYYSTFQLLFDIQPECGAEFGWSMALADLDGDGRLELVAGSDTANEGGVGNSGRITVFDLARP